MKNTTVYLIRHSTRFNMDLIDTFRTNQNDVLKNEKIILSVEGEKRAEILANEEELQNIDVVYTSYSVRTLQTAKYLLDKQGLRVNIDDRLDERRLGERNDDVVKNWFELQYLDENYKTVGGESQRDVRNRMEEAFFEIVEKHKGKRIAIFSHGYAITFFLLKWAEMDTINVRDTFKYTFKGKVFFDKRIEMPEVFKIVLDENNEPISIENIEFDDLKGV